MNGTPRTIYVIRNKRTRKLWAGYYNVPPTPVWVNDVNVAVWFMRKFDAEAHSAQTREIVALEAWVQEP